MSLQVQTIIDAWARNAMKRTVRDQLEDGRWFARVPGCVGAIATADTEHDVERELFSVLEEWALLGMQLGDEIPEFDGVSLNTAESRNLATYHD